MSKIIPASEKKSILDTCQPGEYAIGQKVSLVLHAQTDLGLKAIVNGKHWGVIYSNEIFQDFEKGQIVDGYIKKIREDGRIDLILYQEGNKDSGAIGQKILEKLKASGGYLKITDKTSPEEIYDLFGVSKKKYKMALGGLYKKRLIQISDDGIKLV